MLPTSVVVRETVELSGGTVEIRPMSFEEVKVMGKHAESNAYAIATSTDLPLEEALAWAKTADFRDVAKLLDAILKFNGLGEGAQKSE